MWLQDQMPTTLQCSWLECTSRYDVNCQFQSEILCSCCGMSNSTVMPAILTLELLR